MESIIKKYEEKVYNAMTSTLSRFVCCLAFHKSYWVCKSSQYCAETLKAFSNFKAISALMPFLQFINSEAVFLETPIFKAKAVTVRL